MEKIMARNRVINHIAWEYVLLTCVFVGGLLLTVRSGFVQFLFGIEASGVYQFLFVLAIIVGCTKPVDLVRDIADTFNGLMAIPNFIALSALSGVVARLTREHVSKSGRRHGR